MKKIVVSLIIGIVVAFFYWNHSFFFIESNFQDRLTVDTRDGDLRIKILAIDGDSLNEVGRWPWSRELLADTAEALVENGATAVWLDLMYSEASPNEGEDQRWEDLVATYDNIYLSSYFEFKPRQIRGEPLAYDSFQQPVYEMEPEQIGHINVFQDRDRVVRRSILGVPYDGEMVPSISARLANLLLPVDSQITWDQHGNWFRGDTPIATNDRNEFIFSYASKPRETTFDVFPIHRVISGEIDPSYFSGSLVLIGPYTVGLQDHYYTPMSNTIPMYGVEIHANIIQSLYDNYIFEEATKPMGALIVIGTAILAFFTIDFVRPKWAIFVALAFLAVYTIMFTITFHSQHLILPLIYPYLAIIFAYVTSVVWQYLAERMEKQRVTGIFGRYVSKSVVDELLATKEEITVGGERKDVTLMFVDIRGFTPLSEKMEPEEVINILNEYLDLCSRAVFANEGTIDKFMGDGVMVIFGAPIVQEDHAKRAVRTALMMQSEAEALSDRLQEKYGRSVAFGIGINSGPAVVGNIGSNERLDYTAIGDTVNLAARLESNAKPNQVLISESAYEQIQDEFACTKLEPIKVKGKEQPVQIYQLEGNK